MPVMTQFQFDPATYLELMRDEVPAYGRLQEEVAAATAGLAASSVLDLGTGTGETLAAVLAPLPRARPPSGSTGATPCSGRPGSAWRGSSLELRVAELTDPLPAGPFDLVVSALAIHHLEGAGQGGPLRPHRGRGPRPGAASCWATWSSPSTRPTP